MARTPKKANGTASEKAPAVAPKAQTPAVRAKSTFADALKHHQAKELSKAVELYNRVLLIDPQFLDALNNLGVALRAMGNHEAAVAAYRRLLVLRPAHESTWVNLGNVLRDRGGFEEAITVFNRALTLDPKSRGALLGLSLACRDLNWLQQSLEYVERAIALAPEDPGLNWDRALTLLRMGDYKRGWDAYEWRWKLGHHRPRKFKTPEWNGESLKGKTILLYGEQGFGDAIQFVRFLPMFRDRHKDCRIILELRPELLPLMEGQNLGVDLIVARETGPPPFDRQFPLLSLPRALGVTIATLPRQPYLAPRKGRVKIPAATKNTLNVGITWAGSPTQGNNHNRSFPLKAMLPLFELPYLKLWSLQKGKSTADIKNLGLSHVVSDLDPLIQNFGDTSAVIGNLDLVITADTSVAHLAGAMGKPTWIALSVFHDWRYDPVGGIAHWYPTARVFRQKRPSDWTEVFERIARSFDPGALST